MVNNFTVITKNAGQTLNLGESLGKKLKNKDIVALYGDLGSGKTQIVKGICKSLGIPGIISSPTFIIVNEYKGHDGINVYHFDLYRIKSEDEVINIGFDDYMNKRGIILIEWPEHIERLLPAETIKIHLAHTNECETCRYIRLEKPSITAEQVTI